MIQKQQQPLIDLLEMLAESVEEDTDGDTSEYTWSRFVEDSIVLEEATIETEEGTFQITRIDSGDDAA